MAPPAPVPAAAKAPEPKAAPAPAAKPAAPAPAPVKAPAPVAKAPAPAAKPAAPAPAPVAKAPAPVAKAPAPVAKPAAPAVKAPAPAAKAPVKAKTAKQPVIKADAIFPPETLLKKQKALDKNTKALSKAKAERKLASKAKRQTIFKRNASYEKEYYDAERALIKAKRDARKAGSYYVEAQPKLVFVIRIKGVNKIPPKPRKVLQLLRLLQINAGVFVRVTKATSELLKLIEPYVAYGYPSYSTVRQLVYKRGYGKVNKQRIPLTENSIIEANLGKYGIISIDDLIHEIVSVGPNFKQANNFLWPFKLSNPSGGWGVRRKFQHFIQGGSFGNREDNINSLIKSMN